MADASRVAVVVVTYDALPWIERCLASVRRCRDLVVDNGSSDGTVAFVRERFPDVSVIEAENRGLGAGWNIGIRRRRARTCCCSTPMVALQGALERLVEFAERRLRAAVVGPRLLNPDGTLQRSVRGFPTVWRLATEYLFLRKLAPGSSASTPSTRVGSTTTRSVTSRSTWAPACLPRREAIEQVGAIRT